MDIVDAQLHLGPGMVEPTLEAMNALGIRSVLIDEYWVKDLKFPDQIDPGYRMPNGAWRATYPVAEQASIQYPDRFSYFVRVDRRDPDLEAVMRLIAAEPHARAFRLQATPTYEEANHFIAGAYDGVLEIAQEIGMPVCMAIQGYAEHLAPYLERFPKVSFVLDHLGMGIPGFPRGRPEAENKRTLQPDYYDEVLKLAEYPNLTVKLSHAHFYFKTPDYPYEPLRPIIRRAIGAFGADRLIWSSDKTMIPAHTWGDLLNYLRLDPELSQDEKEQILGRTARKVFDWPVD